MDFCRSENVADKQCGALRTVDISIYHESSFDDENAGNDKNSDEDKREDFDYHDYSAEWQHSAVAFDRFMFALSCAITISAIISTSILYAV